MRLWPRRRRADAAGPGDTAGDGFHGDDEVTVAISRKRFARRQRARRWLAWRRILVGVVAVAVLAGGGWLVFFSSVLAVTGSQVAGTAVVDDATVRRAAQVPVGTPLATVDTDAIAERVGLLPAVRSVDVSRSWPDRVRIEVVEREAVAVVDRGDGPLRGVDATGTEFRSYPARPRGLPLISVGAKGGARNDALAEATVVASSLPADLARRVRRITVHTVDTISLELRSGRIVRWGSANASREKARVLTVLLGQKARLYDVRVPGQPVLRK